MEKSMASSGRHPYFELGRRVSKLRRLLELASKSLLLPDNLESAGTRLSLAVSLQLGNIEIGAV